MASTDECSWAGCDEDSTHTVHGICVWWQMHGESKYTDAPYCSPHAAAMGAMRYESTPLAEAS